jgi:hypothetical protein
VLAIVGTLITAGETGKAINPMEKSRKGNHKKRWLPFLFSDQKKVINFTPLQGLGVSLVFPRTP